MQDVVQWQQVFSSSFSKKRDCHLDEINGYEMQRRDLFFITFASSRINK